MGSQKEDTFRSEILKKHIDIIDVVHTVSIY